jgi:hypothetical protein
MHPSYKKRNVSTKKILIFSTERRLKHTVHKAVVKGGVTRYCFLDYFSFNQLLIGILLQKIRRPFESGFELTEIFKSELA